MLTLSAKFINRPILSLRVGHQVATALTPIINPNNLKIEAWYAQDLRSNARLILQQQSVREVIPEGIIINDFDELMPLEDLVRLQKIADLDFDLIGKPVETINKQKIGKVVDYAVEPETMMIVKLYLNQNIFKDFSGGGRVIDRKQIFEITDRKVVVKDTEIRVSDAQPLPEPA